MKVLRLCSEKDLHVDEIAEEIDVWPKKVLESLDYLEAVGILTTKGRRNEYGVYGICPRFLDGGNVK